MDLLISREELNSRLALPFELKVAMSVERIHEWYEHWDGRVYVSVSGGLDSTVLWHLVRSVYPNVPGVCVDALLYPENRALVKGLQGVEIVRPEMPFHKAVKEYGWPVVSKDVSYYVRQIQNAKGETATKRLRLTGYTSSGKYSKMSKLADKWHYLCDGPFKISDKCCDILKKKPLRKASKEYGHPYIGVRVGESRRRKETYLQYSCNAFEIKSPRAWPLAIWTDADIWAYIELHGLEYSKLYDMGYKSSGCFACPFGAHMEKEPNRFQMMQETHPKLWRYCEKIGLPEVLDFIGVPYGPVTQPRLFK